MTRSFSFITFLFILFYNLSCNSTSRSIDCVKFKEGKFIHTLELDSTVYLIDRKDSIQIETNTRTGNVVTSRIKWLNPCEYEVLYQSQSAKAYDPSLEFMRNRPMKTKIITTGKDYYVFEARIDSFNFKYTDTLRVRNK